MKKLEWVFGLVDKVSGPSNKMTAALNRFTKKLQDVKASQNAGGSNLGIGSSIMRTFEALGGVLKGPMESVATLLTGLKSGIDLAMGLAAAMAAVARGVFNAGYSFGEFVVSVAAERESSLTALRTVLGRGQTEQEGNIRAQRAFADSLRIAQLTPFETADVIRDRMQLVLAGFTERESTVLYAAAADVGSALGPERQQTLMRAFARIHAQGQLSGEALMELDAAGVGRSAIFERLATQMGRRQLLGNQRALRAWAEPLLGRMSSDRALQLIVSTIGANISGGGAVGSFSVGQSNTLNGIISNLKSLPHDLFAGMDFENLDGMRGFKQFLQDFMRLFDQATPRGQRFTAMLRHIVDSLFGGLFGRGESQLAGMQTAFDQVTSIGERFAMLLERIVPLVRAFVTGFGSGALSGLATVLGGLNSGPTQDPKTWEKMGESIGHAVASLISFAGTIMSNVIPALNAILHPLDTIWDRLTDFSVHAGSTGVGGINISEADAAAANADTERFWSGVAQTARDALGIHSPSSVFYDIGSNTVQGYLDGLNGRAGDIDGAVSGLFRLGDTASLSALRLQVQHTHDMTVRATGDGEVNARAAGAIGDRMSANIRDYFRRADTADVDS